MYPAALSGAIPRILALTFVLALALAPATTVWSQEYEVWTVDQANAEDGGDRLYIYTPGW